METVDYLRQKARQCRRLARATNDARTIAGLTAMAEEFEAKASGITATDRTKGLPGNGQIGRLMPDDAGDPT